MEWARVVLIVTGPPLELPLRNGAQPTRKNWSISSSHAAWAQLGSELVYFLVSMGPKFGRTIQLRMGSDLKSGPFLVPMLSWQSAALPRRWATCVSQIDSTVGAPKTSNQTAFYKCFNFVYKKSPCNNRNL